MAYKIGGGGHSPETPHEGTRQRHLTRTAWVYLTPMIIVMLVVAGWPLLRTFWFSFTDANLNHVEQAKWVGFENYWGEYGLFGADYADGFWSSEWGISIKNTLLFAVISVILETVLGMVVALVLNAKFRGRGFVRAAVLVPWAIPTIVSAKIWGWMLNDQYGVINQMLLSVGLISQKIAWTADPAYAFWTVVVVDVWKTTPFMALLILAALQTLPKDCYEAAQVDGISPARVFFKVTLPLIKPALLVAVIFRFLDAMRVFDLIFVLTSNSRNVMSMSGFVRNQMVENAYVGYGSSASIILFLIIGACTIASMAIGRMKWRKNQV